jgi:hypothetical protein
MLGNDSVLLKGLLRLRADEEMTIMLGMEYKSRQSTTPCVTRGFAERAI